MTQGVPNPDEVEIGGTWLAADIQRSAVNTESKLLMLSHTFDVWNVDRSRWPRTSATIAAAPNRPTGRHVRRHPAESSAIEGAR